MTGRPPTPEPTETRRARMRAVLAAHGRVPIDDLDEILDELEAVIGTP